MNERLIDYLENSFISPLLKNEDITDVSYNGANVFYMNNKLGRKKSDIQITPNEVSDFVRQIANLAEKQFSYTNPIMDFSISRYRINVVHSSIARYKDEKAISFSIRIASLKNRIVKDSKFATKEQMEHIKKIIESHESIVIAGATGSGKTELQKHLLSLLPPYSRIIVIDNVQELECLREYEDLDLTSWQVNPNNVDRDFEPLIRNALRSNPDWLIISESRGKEMSEVLLSVMSGHPIITTLHADDVTEIPSRIARMVLLKNENQKYEDVFKDVISHFKNYIYLKREVSKDKKVHRYISAIGRVDQKQNQVKKLFERSSYEKE